MPGSLLVASDIKKRFGGVLALDGVGLALEPHERLAVVGENGAGKSTLMRVLTGLTAPDDGSVLVEGRDITGSSIAAQSAGIALVHQERSLVPELSVEENITLGNAATRFGFVQSRKQREAAVSTLSELGLTHLNPTTSVGRLSAAHQAFVEIAKALHAKPRILIMDEPSAMLTPTETNQLLELVMTLSEQGTAIVYISHRIPEIYAFCESALVLRDGRAVGNFALGDVGADELITHMAGRALRQDRGARREMRAGTVAVKAEGLVTHRLRDVSLTLHAGEIVGIGGLVGSGRTALLRSIVGLDRRFAGRVEVTGPAGVTNVRTFAKAVKSGVGFVPEERRTEGIILSFAVGESLMLPAMARGWGFRLVKPAALTGAARSIIERLRVVPANPRAEVASLSGGNQQKVSFGKWLSVEPRVLILDEPTRGVDVGAKAEIHRLLRRWADDGIAVLFVSSETPELIALADRILVMRDGALVAALDRGEATEERILAFAAGHERELGGHGV